jgi:predicted RNase H-like nuclease
VATEEFDVDGPIGEDWRARLELLLAEAVAIDGVDAVRATLRAESDRLTGPSGPAPLAVHVPVLGVDACWSGWVGVLLSPARPPAVLAAAAVAALVEVARETSELAVVAIDIPIGLPDAGGRQADALARRALPGKGSSVFTTLTRAAYAAETYEQGRAENLAATDGVRSASAQAYALRAKILEVDGWLRQRPAVDVIEVHPELSFARMTGSPILARKKDPDGVRQRREALEAVGLVAPAWYRGSGFGEDDLLDACAAAWSAVRYAAGEAESLPPVPEVFSDGIPAAIRV